MWTGRPIKHRDLAGKQSLTMKAKRILQFWAEIASVNVADSSLDVAGPDEVPYFMKK